jgi:hypothetical protein
MPETNDLEMSAAKEQRGTEPQAKNTGTPLKKLGIQGRHRDRPRDEATVLADLLIAEDDNERSQDNKHCAGNVAHRLSLQRTLVARVDSGS